MKEKIVKNAVNSIDLTKLNLSDNVVTAIEVFCIAAPVLLPVITDFFNDVMDHRYHFKTGFGKFFMELTPEGEING